MTWLITGGAGYIGAHVVRVFRYAGLPVVVLDDLTTGVRERLPDDVPFVEASVLDEASVRRALREHEVGGVVHLAAKKQVAESVADPVLYYRENVGGCTSLLQAMLDVGVQRLLFSSSAAVYGSPTDGMVREDSPTKPINPYGATKLVCEELVRAVGVASQLSWISLRYFNVAGTADAALADRGVTNLIPMVLSAVARDESPLIFGDDYATPDGTCVRDFIHVTDLARAHLAAAQAVTADRCAAVYNVGRGDGASVRQVMDLARRVTGKDARPRVVPRRAGDPASVVADPGRIRHDLGWQADHDLTDMIESAWSSWTVHRSDLSARS